MRILIKGMEMPEICFMCPVYDGGNGCCKITLQNCLIKPDWCPLVEVPTPHGRLGDLDRLYKHIKAECNIYGKPTIGFEDGNKVLKIIADTRTVIEAEEDQR